MKSREEDNERTGILSLLLSWILVIIAGGAGLFWLAKRPAGTQKPAVSPESRSAGHELSEASAKGVMWFAIAFFLGAIVMNIGLGSMFFALRRYHRAQAHSASSTGLHLVDQRAKPPEPRLQPNPQRDLEAYLRKEKQRLSSYGWTNEKEDRVRIPVEKAMDRLVRSGSRPQGGSR